MHETDNRWNSFVPCYNFLQSWNYELNLLVSNYLLLNTKNKLKQKNYINTISNTKFEILTLLKLF